MRYIISLLMIVANPLFSETTQHKQITLRGTVSHHVANSKTYNDGKDFYIVKPIKIGKNRFSSDMQLIFDPDEVEIKIKENSYQSRYNLKGHIVDRDYKKNLRFYTYQAFQVDAAQEIASKIKAKAKGDITYVKFMLKNRMNSPKLAKERREPFRYIKSIQISADDEMVLDMKTSYYIAENPIIKFSYNNRDAQGSILKLRYVDNKNLVSTNERKIKSGEGSKRVATPFIPSTDAKRYRVKSKAIEKIFGNMTLIEDGIELISPKLAENGGSIPIRIKSNIDAKSVTLFSLGDSGDLEFAVQFITTPHSIIDYSFRIKMRESHDVQVVIEAKDGKFYTIKRDIDVSIGGGEV